MESLNFFILAGALILFIGLLLGSLSPRIGVPSLLVFLGVGMAAGENGIGGIQFEDVDLAFLISNLALTVILLDGGLRTRLETFRVGLKPALTLATVGVALSAMFTGAFATWLLGVDWRVGLLLGGIIGSTDAAAVFSMIRSAGVRINERVASTLEIESGLNDPMAIFITVLLIDLLLKPDISWGVTTLTALIQQFGVGALLGIGLGILLAELLLRVRSNEGLHALLLCTGGLTLWAVTNLLGGSGFLAAYVAGLVAGNWRSGTSDNVLRSMDSMAWLSQSGMFLLLGLLVSPKELLDSLLPGLLIAAFLMLVARPLTVWLLLLPFAFPRREQIFIAWTGLRGAVPIVLAVFPLMAGLEQSRLLFDIVFVVVISSLLLQGTTLGPMARWLKLALPPAAKPLTEVALEGVDNQFVAQFRIEAGSRADGKELGSLVTPGARAVALVRAGASLPLEGHLMLQAGDTLSLLASHGELEQLSEWFLSSTAELRRFYGDFTVHGSVQVDEVARTYGLTDLAGHELTMSLKQLFRHRHSTSPVVGDTIYLAGIRLRVRAIENGRISLVGIQLSKE